MTAGAAAKRGPAAFSHREGVAAKRRHGPRTDRDGDLMMDGGPQAAGRISKGRGRGGPARDTGSTAPSRNILNNTAVQKEIARHLATSDAIPRGPRAGNSTHKHLQDLRITGWKKSKAASNPDGGVRSLVEFLEKRGSKRMAIRTTTRGAPPQSLRIKKYRIEGDDFIVSLPSDEAATLLLISGYDFAGAKITITRVERSPRSTSPLDAQNISQEVIDLKQLLQNFLSRRYNPELKLLDLSAIGQDSELNAIGMFKDDAAQSKFFPALMKTCDGLFKSAQEKKDTVHSVTLASNELAETRIVASLAPTFPDLKNLDLSNNQFKDLESLQGFKTKFRHLDHLVLTGNPLEHQVPDYNLEMVKWYPTLRILNGVQVRSDEEAARADNAVTKNPLPVRLPVFQDEAQIAETFVKNFFYGFDGDRNALVNHYYDSNSTFSLSVNTKALRDPSNQDKIPPQEWDAYIKRSRNLKAVTHIGARMSRSHQGVDDIKGIWETLPMTRHPNLATEPQKWLIECQPQPGVPDPTGMSPTGVGGFLITVHGEYEEIDVSTGQSKKRRSFDRTFILGPGGVSGVRVVSDMWTVRAYGGFAAWHPGPAPAAAPPVQAQATPEMMVAQLSNVTGMKPEFSRQCLKESGWDMEKAMAAFEGVKATLPKEAFVS